MGRSRAAWLAWSMGALSTGLAVAAVILAGRNGERPAELVFNHHAIGIVTAIGLAVLGALIAAHQPRNPIGWLMAAVTVVPAAVLAVRAWPVRGPELVLQSFEHPSLDGVFSTGFVLVLALSVVALAAQPRLAPSCWHGCGTTHRPRAYAPVGGPRAGAPGWFAGACSKWSPGSCSSCWNARTVRRWSCCGSAEATTRPDGSPPLRQLVGPAFAPIEQEAGHAGHDLQVALAVRERPADPPRPLTFWAGDGHAVPGPVVAFAQPSVQIDGNV
jgi:hypothetical protein